MIEDKSTHKKIIRAITTKWGSGEPFAIWEVRDASGCSTSSVTRVVKKLVQLDILRHTVHGFMGRHYRVTYKWTSVDDVIESYEYAKVLKL